MLKILIFTSTVNCVLNLETYLDRVLEEYDIAVCYMSHDKVTKFVLDTYVAKMPNGRIFLEEVEVTDPPTEESLTPRFDWANRVEVFCTGAGPFNETLAFLTNPARRWSKLIRINLP